MKRPTFSNTTKAIGLLALSGIIISVMVSQLHAPEPPLEASFTTLQGNTLQLSALRGKPVLITFWATDCPSCIKEMPALIQLYQRYHPQGFESIAVSMYYDIPSHVVEMSQHKQLPYPIALDLKGNLAHIFGNVQVTPTSFLLSPAGHIVQRYTGVINMTDVATQLDIYLKG
jgi:thiol-disulfide isomerase/thioredoxin